jgi:MerR family regulatory protein
VRDKYLRAGEFGAAARLSSKALRLYAEEGLLVPASVDPATGYRLYSPVDDLYIRLVPAHTEAYLPVPAELEDLPLILRVYDAVEAWADAWPGVTCMGHPYEIYPGTGARFDVAYPVTH